LKLWERAPVLDKLLTINIKKIEFYYTPYLQKAGVHFCNLKAYWKTVCITILPREKVDGK
jgi:hypothetical protein